ncbi:hypothetical protein [Actinoallomurus iriomotensis]|uniref:Uncharacterized protein n=1 Tax=Actinoallomurus iriomotensis TaxID=478107 RepID=A0A9W6RLM1_9ACTN|nr:hypothetical protein [Actinoallomurus iriomotensis]GLY78019.1 hypothetical protein Airi01_062860 [Actinoallomurus iriomotensis]
MSDVQAQDESFEIGTDSADAMPYPAQLGIDVECLRADLGEVGAYADARTLSGDGFGFGRGLDRIDDLLAGILQAVAPHQASASHPDTVMIRRQSEM